MRTRLKIPPVNFTYTGQKHHPLKVHLGLVCEKRNCKQDVLVFMLIVLFAVCMRGSESESRYYYP